MTHVLLCVEGGGRIGLGHVYRSVALAQAIEARGATVGVQLFGPVGVELVERLLREAGVTPVVADPDVAVIDRREVMPRTPPEVPLVELVDEHLDRSRVTPHAIASFEGPPFQSAILRAEFRGRPAVPAEDHPEVLLTLGGVDPTGSTSRILEGLQKAQLPVRAIVGPGAPDGEGRAQPVPMAFQMKWAGVVVASGGMTVLEAAALGRPVFSVSHNAREHERMTRLAARVPWLTYCGPAPSVDARAMGEQIARLMADRERLIEMGLAAAADVDGRGADRAAAQVLFLAPREEEAPTIN